MKFINLKYFIFRALHLPDAYEMYLDTKNLIVDAPAPGVKMYCLYGIKVPTTEK